MTPEIEGLNKPAVKRVLNKKNVKEIEACEMGGLKAQW